MTEPSYFSEAAASSTDGAASSHQVSTMEQPAHRVTPSKKMLMLKTITTPRRKLAAQGSGVQVCSARVVRWRWPRARSSTAAASKAPV
jgi:hypothetical protein